MVESIEQHAEPDSLEDEILRLGLDEIEFATRAAKAIARNPEESVHAFRKSIKRLRALIRFGKACDRRAWRRVDHRLRDAGRLLSKARDASVLERRAREFEKSDDVLVRVDGAIAPDRIPEVTELLSQTRPALEKFLTECEWSLERLLAALGENAAKAARDRRRFRKRNRAEDAHAWRKGVQRCLNQLRLIGALLQPAAAVRIAELDTLSDCLGAYHDLSVLGQALESGEVEAADKAGLSKQVEARQAALRERALALSE